MTSLWRAFSIRWLIFSVIALVALTSVLATYLILIPAANQLIEEQQRILVSSRLARLQGTLEYAYRLGDAVNVRRELAATSASAEVAWIAVLDKDRKVVAASDLRLVGQGLSSLSVNAGIVERLLERGGPASVENGPDGLIIGYTTLKLGLPAGSIRDLAPGVLVLAQDVAVRQNQARQEMMTTVGLISGLLVVGAGIIAVLTHVLLTRRVSRLLASAQALAAGNLAARSQVSGRDEIGELGAAFDEMAVVLQRRAMEAERDRKAIAASNARATEIIKASPVPHLIFNRDNAITLLNRAFVSAFGYEKSEIGTLTEWARRAFPDAAIAMKLLDDSTTASSEGPSETKAVELSVRTSSREPRDVIMTWTRLGSGFSDETVVSLLDVTDLRQLTKVLRESESRLNRVLAATNDGWWESNLLADTTVHSPRWLEMFGFANSSEVSGTAQHLFSAPMDSAEVDAAFAAAERDRQDTFKIEHHITHKNGQLIPVRSNVFITRDTQGTPIRLSGMTTDLTEWKAAERRLRQSQRLEAVGQLTAGVAHDFNNLLAIVMNSVEMLRDDKGLSAESDRSLRRALKAVERGSTLTHHLLAFAKKQALVPQLVDLRAEVNEAAKLIQKTLPESIEFSVVADHASVVAKVDAGQLTHTLINLAINARDAMPDAGRLIISVRRESDKSDPKSPTRALITVTDTGSGMSEDVRRRAFEPFFTTKDVGKGSGLGLSMVHGFMEQSGGEIELHSVIGKGTTVRLLFPLAADIQSPEDADAPASGGPTNGVRRRVLLVEDIEDLRETFVLQLQSLGYAVTAAADGRQALELCASEQPFDVMITDLGLPGGMNGAELAAEVSKRHPLTRIITMTGYNSAAEGIPKGEGEHLLKPFTRAALQNAVAAAVGGR